MDNIKLGSQVMLATMENITFEVVHENMDGSFEIEAKISEDQTLKYGNISREMMRILK